MLIILAELKDCRACSNLGKKPHLQGDSDTTYTTQNVSVRYLSCLRLACSLLLATGSGGLCLGNTSDLLDSALDFLSLLSALLSSYEIAVLYNNGAIRDSSWRKRFETVPAAQGGRVSAVEGRECLRCLLF